MSSHHFVREGQEPALFVLEKSSFQFAQPLLEWVPLVMVLDDVLEDVLQWGIKIDVVVQCNIPLGKVGELLIDQQPVQILPAEKNAVISTGLKYFIDNDYEAVNLIGNVGEDVFQAVEQLTDRLQVGIYDKHLKWSFITTGIFEKWMPAGYRFFVRADRTSIETDGITKKGGTWETSAERMVIIRAQAPFWVGEQY